MVSTEEAEDRLRTLFDRLSALVETEPGSERASHFVQETVETRRLLKAIPPWGIAALIGPTALALSAAAAAASPGRSPSIAEIMGAARALSSSGAAIRQSSAELRVSAAGPAGTQFEVFSMPVGYENSVAGTCVRLVVVPESKSLPTSPSAGQFNCSLVGSNGPAGLNNQQVRDARSGAGQAVSEWTSPTGNRYEVVYGFAGTAGYSVALAARGGEKGTAASVVKGWFVIELPLSEASRFPYLKVYGKSGKVLYTVTGSIQGMPG